MEDNLDELWDPIKGMVVNAMGVAYAYGRGVGQDMEAGVRYFELAAGYGCKLANEHLEYIRLSGMEEQ